MVFSMVFSNMTDRERGSLEGTIESNKKKLKDIKADPSSFKKVCEKGETIKGRVEHLEFQIRAAETLLESPHSV